MLVYSVRSPIRSPLQAPGNRFLDAAVLLSACLVAAAVYVPALHGPLGTVSLRARTIGATVGLALAPFAAVEIGKAVLRRRGWAIDPEHSE